MRRPLSQAEKLTPEQRGRALLTGFLMTPAAMIAYTSGNTLGLRHSIHMPYALQPFEHLGNVWPTIPVALAAPLIAASLEKRVDASKVTRTSRIAAAGVIGMALAAGLNATTETTYGNNHIGNHLPLITPGSSLPTASDMSWGTATGIAVGVGFAAWRDRKITENAAQYNATATGSDMPLPSVNVSSNEAITAHNPVSSAQLDAMMPVPSLSPRQL